MNTGGLVAPADVQTIDEGGIARSIHGSQSSAPTWGVGDPVATALSGLSGMVDKYAKAYDDVVVNDYTMQKSKELDELYNNPDTGIFNTLKGDKAKGAYQNYKNVIRDIWDHDAMDNLTERQRDMASKHLYTLFSSYGHRVAEFETKQLMGAQTERCKNTVQNAIDLMGTGRATDDDIANAMNAIRMAYENMGQMQGWDAETIARMQNEATSDGFTKASAALATFDPIAAYGLLQANQAFMTPAAHAGAVQALEGKLNSVYQEEYIRRLEAGDKEGAERWLVSHTAPVGSTGKARILAKHESGTQGSMHVSYGLPRTDGVDVGKYSFITKGGNGGSVGEFIRWAGKQGDLGKQLYDKFYALTGGNWAALDSKDLWKNKGGQAAWQDLVKSDPKNFEKLEDNFWLPRLEAGISKLRPEVQAAIRADKTGALYEMAISTINQHKSAINILNSNFDADPATYIKKVYQDRSNPSRFAATGDSNIGVRRMREEVRDVLGILNGGSQGNEYRPVPGALKPSQIIALQSRGKTMIDKIHVDNAYEVLLGMDRNEAKQQLMTVEGQQKLGLDSEQAAILWRKITPYWNTVAKQEMDKGVGDVIKTVRDLPLEDRDGKAVELLQKQFPDETEFANAAAEYAKRMKREDKMQVAASWQKLRPVIDEGVRQGKSKYQIWQEIKDDQSGQFSDYDKAAIDNLRKVPKENEASRKAMGKLLAQGNAMLQEGYTAKDVMSWFEGAAFGDLTQSQIKKGLGYFENEGNIGGVSLARCDNLYRRLLGAKGKNAKGIHMPELGYALILDNLDPKVTKYSDEQLAELISAIMIEEFGNYNWLWNTKMTIFDAVKNNNTDELMETDEEKLRKIGEEFKARQGYSLSHNDLARMAMERPYRKYKFDGVRTTNASK